MCLNDKYVFIHEKTMNIINKKLSEEKTMGY